MIIHRDIIQGTPEWDIIRTGKLTASVDYQQLVTGRKDTYTKLIRKKAAERITGRRPEEKYDNSHMIRGRELETEAIAVFELETGLMVERVGFIEGSEYYGCSPDGLIGNDGGLEVKCKDIHTHLDCFLDGYDKTYKWQIQGNLYVSERKWWIFASYNPHYAHIGKQLYTERIERDEEAISQIVAGIKKGIEDIKSVAMVMTTNKI